MNCAYHSDREVRGVCSTCGRPICEDCMVDLNGSAHCKTCLSEKVHKAPRDVRGFLRFALSICPGLGHMYMGLFNRGLQLMVGAIAGGIVLDMIAPRSPLSGFFIAALVFLSIFDAREAHLRLEQGLEVEDKGFVDIKNMRFEWRSRYIGYGLVAIGVLGLYNTLVHDTLRLVCGYNSRVCSDLANSIDGILLGGLAVAAGVWLLKRSVDKPSDH